LHFILVFLFAALMTFPAFAVEKLTPRAAYALVAGGDMVLVDIRRPDEWAATGVAKGALRINMLDGDFKWRIEALRAANPSRKIALICQAGVRSARMSQLLENKGLSGLVDVTGGTAQWIELGLPVSR
jgi:rhodanese-related sulfurtransferase